LRSAAGSSRSPPWRVLLQASTWDGDENRSGERPAPPCQRQGIPVAKADGETWLFVACYGNGSQRLFRIDPLDIAVFGASATDWYDGYLWVVDATNHEIVRVDPTTGYSTGVKITGLPGSSTTDLEIQQ
jgi:hypothetical protein